MPSRTSPIIHLPLPNTPTEAQEQMAIFSARVRVARRHLADTLEALRAAQDDLDACRQIAAGEFEEDAPAGPYVQSSRGPWCLEGRR
jgi:hypothetical protein